MKCTSRLAALVSALALLSSAPVLGDTPGAKPGASNSPQQQGETKPVSDTKKRPRTDADARHCLTFPTNREIIKCAEQYL